MAANDDTGASHDFVQLSFNDQHEPGGVYWQKSASSTPPANRPQPPPTACPRYDGWNAETAAAKRRFRTPGCHALLHAVLAMAQAC